MYPNMVGLAERNAKLEKEISRLRAQQNGLFVLTINLPELLPDKLAQHLSPEYTVVEVGVFHAIQSLLIFFLGIRALLTLA